MKTACGRGGCAESECSSDLRPAVAELRWDALQSLKRAGKERSGLLLKHLAVLAVCGAACVRAICLNRRCLANALGFTEISVFPALLGIFAEPPLPAPPAGRAEGRNVHPAASG